MRKPEEADRMETFPDGTPIDEWFYDADIPTLERLGRPYVITEYNILDDGKLYTEELQALIERAAGEGGGVIVVPRGTYLTGALFFRQGVNLYIAEGGTLKGSDDISDYPLCETRIEGETCLYYPALVNADGLDGFTLCGKGTIDGNGLRSWRSFWNRRRWNPQCTNKDEQRPRLVYISHCSNVTVAELHLQNAHFWTNHIYKSDHVRFIGCTIFSPRSPVAAPSTDAIDIDACTDVLVKNCYMEVNDDAVALKGGKGPWADAAPENGANERILIEDCEYGFCHGCLTCGSEAVHNRNIIVRRIQVRSGYNLLWLKFRPDTPQHYEYISVEEVEGKVERFLNINPWRQFFDLKGREDMPLSYADNIVMKRCDCECRTFFCVSESEQYTLSDFHFEQLRIKAQNPEYPTDIIRNMTVRDVAVEAARFSENGSI
ncbi:MAG: glycosyl hydrolase family 28 protein [Roseburia sp.]|nr:glycosyl hydrolase family 28 protein [Roseburia sp.]